MKLFHNDFFDVLMLSISLAVAAIPEGMSSIITIILSLGMTAMAKKNVIVKNLVAVDGNRSRYQAKVYDSILVKRI